MTVAKVVLEQLAAERFEYVADHDFLCWSGQGISTGMAACAVQKALAAQNGEELGDVWLREPFRSADLGDGEAAARSLIRDRQQAAQPVFLLRGELHGRCAPSVGVLKF